MSILQISIGTTQPHAPSPNNDPLSIAIVGESVRFNFIPSIAQADATLGDFTSPDGSSVSGTLHDGPAFTPDCGGLFTTTVGDGMEPPRRCRVGAFWPSALTDPRVCEIGRQVLPGRTIPGTPRPEIEIRRMLLRWVDDAARTGKNVAEILSALTPAEPLPVGVCWDRWAGEG